MEAITLTTLAALLAPYFIKAGETLATETVKLGLEKRQDIKDSFVNLFKPDEIITLGLDKPQTPEEIKQLQEANPEVAKSVHQKIESNPDLLKQLLEVIKEQTGKDSSQITINAEKIGQVIGDNYGTINSTQNF